MIGIEAIELIKHLAPFESGCFIAEGWVAWLCFTVDEGRPIVIGVFGCCGVTVTKGFDKVGGCCKIVKVENII